MQKHLVMTLTGPDRVGIVEYITKIILDYGGNVEAGRMARLGGEFTVLMMVAVPEQNIEDLREGVRGLREEGFKINTRQTERGYSAKYVGWIPYHVKVNGADHEGIIHHVTRYLAENGINIETMDTGMFLAPMSGTPLFTMAAVVVVPPELAPDWRDELVALGDDLNVDIEVTPYAG